MNCERIGGAKGEGIRGVKDQEIGDAKGEGI